MSFPSMPPPPDPQPVVTCYRHPDRRAGVRCQRCERPICPTCMSQASVGFQCPECISQGAKRAPVYSASTLPGTPPLATYVFIGLNVAVFLLQVATMGPGGDLISGTTRGPVVEAGILWGPAVYLGEWWRLVTGGFLHGGILHLGMNMYFLYLIGPQLEGLLGRARFVALYLAALLAGSLGVMLVSPDAATLGASGAIFGLLGAAAAYQLSNRVNIWQSGLGRLILINVVITFVLSSFISVGGHLGGLIGGAGIGYLLFELARRRVPALVGTALAGAAAVGFAVGGVVVAYATFAVL